MPPLSLPPAAPTRRHLPARAASRRPRRARAAAFTLLEIMLVVLIISLLLGFAVYKLRGNVDAAKIARANGDIKTFGVQLTVYESLAGSLPTTEQGLAALVSPPQSEPRPNNWRQLMSELTNDPWGQPYVYVCPGRKHPESYDLYSKGPDHLPDTGDDIGN